MYELTPNAALSWSFEIEADGRTIGSLTLKRLKPAGTLKLNDRTFEIARDGLFGPFSLVENGREIARAERTAFLTPRYQITAGDRQLLLNSKGFLRRMAQVFHGDTAIGTITRTSLFRRGIHVDAPPETPLPALMFCAALMILFWRHQSRSRG